MNTTMLNNTRSNAFQQTPGGLDLSPLRLTALTYLAEARIKEDYEQMNDIVLYAKEFGATGREINAVLGV
jgi:hypothetical protein